MVPKKISQKCKKIKLLITDVDGVLTDGGMYYSEKGELLKKFNARDGMGVELLHKILIKTVFLTSENSKIVKARAKKVKADDCYVNIKRKEIMLPTICKKFNVKSNNIAYIGDDVNDAKIMKHVGLSAVPSNGTKEVKLISDFKCKKRGGEGAFREFAELLISESGFNLKK